MLRILSVLAVCAVMLSAIVRADAGVVVTVDKTAQRLTVEVDGHVRYQWPVSTARWGYRTPNGTYGVQRLERSWYSRKYDWSPMPHSIFFNGGYAIHGSYEISRLGRPASHGCIRLHPKNAAVLFELVSQRRGSTTIVVTGDRPSMSPEVSRRAPAARARSVERAQSFEEVFYEEIYVNGRRVR